MPTNTQSTAELYGNWIQIMELLVTKCYPRIIVELNELLGTPMFQQQVTEGVRQEVSVPIMPPVLSVSHGNGCIGVQPPSKSGPTDNIVVSNIPVSEMSAVVPAILNTQLTNAHLMNWWITLRNLESVIIFGVAFPEGIKEAMKKFKLNVADCLKLISDITAERVNTIAQLGTSDPHVEEYRKAVVEMDEKTCIALMKVVCKVRDNYFILIDVATMNLNHMKNHINTNTNI